jgi:hypothetical protein
MFNIVQWIREDYHEYPARCVFEVFAWCLNIVCSVIMMYTVPNPPFLLLYPAWIIVGAIFCWGAWTRTSFGMVGNFLLVLAIDFIALYRLI